MVRIDYYISRVVHLLLAGFLLALCLIPLIVARDDPPSSSPVLLLLPKGTTALLAVLTLLSGLYNAGAARPSRLGGAARRYRFVVYVGKVVLLVGMTPLAERVVSSEHVASVRFCMAVMAVMAGSYARYYREEALAVNEGGKKEE